MAAMAPGEPQWEKSIDNNLASALAHRGYARVDSPPPPVRLVVIALLVPALLRPGLAVAAILALSWWVAKDLGGILTSRRTDPNTGPLLVLLEATFCATPAALKSP